MNGTNIQITSFLERIGETGRDLLAMYGRFTWTGKIGLWLMMLIVGMAVFAPVLSPHDPIEQDHLATHAEPSLTHPLGTDNLGRDVMARLMFGARVSLLVAALAVSWAAVVGTIAGAFSGYRGGLVDDILMRLADAIMVFPSLILAIALVAAVEPSIANLAFVIGFSFTAKYARLIRGEVLSVKEEPYVESARGLGMPNRDILFKQILPNSFQPVLVQISFHFPLAILAEAGLSFLGLGIQAPTPSWGRMIRQGQRFMPEIWWPVVFPGLLIVLTVMGFNMVGDSVQDEWDPYEETTLSE